MDLVGLSNTLKNLSDEQLSQVYQTSPEVPPYLVVAEMQRRNEMRKEFQQQMARARPQPSTTVAQNLVAQMRQPAPVQVPSAPPASGIAAMVQQPQAPRMSRGGILALAGGGAADDNTEGPGDGSDYTYAPMPMPALSIEEYNKRYPAPSMQEAVDAARAVQGKDYLGPIADELAQISARESRPNFWKTLAAMGFSMAAAPTHSFGVALGQAGLGALASMEQQRQQYENVMKERLAAAQAQQRDMERVANVAAEIYRAGVARSNLQAQALEASLRKAMADPETIARAKVIQAQNPSVSEAQAMVMAAEQKRRDEAENNARVNAAKLRQEEMSKRRSADPNVQMFNGLVQQIGKRYGIKPDETGEIQFADLPEQAQLEVSSILQKRNPSEWSVFMQAAGNDPKKAVDIAIRYQQARSQMYGADVSPMSLTPLDIAKKYGGVPVGGH